MAGTPKYTIDGFGHMTKEELMAITDEEMEDYDPAICMALARERTKRGLPPRSAESYTV